MIIFLFLFLPNDKVYLLDVVICFSYPHYVNENNFRNKNIFFFPMDQQYRAGLVWGFFHLSLRKNNAIA